MSQAADDNVYLCATIGKVQSIRTYLMELHSMSTSASLSAVEYGTTIYKVTDNNMDIEEDKGTGRLKGISYSYDSTYDTCDIEVKLSGTDDLNSGDARVYLSMQDEDGNTAYYMVYNGDSMDISAENDVLVKVPFSYLNKDTKYAVNLVVQSGGENRMVCGEDAYFS